MKYTITVVLAIATFAIMMTSATSAFGQASPATHAVDPVPAFGNANDVFSMQSVSALDGSAPDNVDIFITRTFVLYDPDVGSSIPNIPDENPGSDCESYTAEVGDRLFEFRNTGTGVHIEAKHIDIRDQTSTIFFDRAPFLGGTGGFGNGASPTDSSVVNSAAFVGLNANSALNNWVELNAAGNPTGNFDSTSQGGQYILVTCGWVDIDQDGFFDGVGTEVISVETRGFIVNVVVGGELMPISATSLLVAGAAANALWILPILGLAGTVIAIRKLEA